MNADALPLDALTHSKLARLIGLLSCDDLDTHETERIAGICMQAIDRPAATLQTHYGADAAKVAQYDPDGVTAFILFVELQDYFAVSDNVDELYEQIMDAFEQPQLPGYPYDDNAFETISDFYRWVDAQLLTHHPNYQLISFGESYTHDFQDVLVYRKQVEEILALCKSLALRAELCA
ncbi:hypothetical protein [Allopusillimonas ginsengisoli]|uniref:hypothetical protein n=1 Tax=Allopusillimonas ginsengisoli TaxID=453575 RepID=UPI001021B2C7|nr:hypothetical protein [Allopusillimonas ginsengisoli]TEA78462.1 hypothetical protein ERE07_08595 [Allopusillimonas ginsengisoli]